MPEPTPDQNAAQNAAQFRRAESVFIRVCDLPEPEREQRLRELCAGDETLEHRLRSLLDADALPSSILAPGLVAINAVSRKHQTDSDTCTHANSDIPPTQNLPDRIGGYEIVGLLGEGGMGVVYEAIQSAPRRPVALKVIRQRSLHAKIRRRFEGEAMILSRLNHPGIASVYASGVSEDPESAGTPYVAMELVRGQPLTEYANAHDLDTEQRLQLLCKVCESIAHAHTVRIVHRDLKPSNILVDERGEPHVLDFGIAIDLELDDQTRMTQTGQLLGTLQYMAPEQLDNHSNIAEPATDVFALGVIGAELLLGEHPFAGHDSSVYTLIRTIRDHEPTLLGTRDRGLRGDPETIIAKAMAREPQRRYHDAGQMHRDLRRYLERRPILARRPSPMYHLVRFSQRNPAVVGSVASVMIVLVVALVLIANALRTASVERTQALHDQRVKALVNEFLTKDLFATGDPNAGGDADISLIDAMLESSSDVGTRFADTPEVEAEIRYTMGSQLRTMNRYEAARGHLERSVQLSQELNLATPLIAERRNELTKLYSDLDELTLALRFVEQTERLIENDPGVPPRTRIETLVSHGSLLFHDGQVQACLPYFERALAIARTHLPGDELTSGVIGDLAIVLTRLRRHDRAVVLHRESIERSVQSLGPEHPSTLVARNNLGVLYLQMGEHDRALRQFQDVLEIRQRVFGDDHTRTYITHSGLGRAYSYLGQPKLALHHLGIAQEGLARLMGEDHRYTRITMGYFADHYDRTDQPILAARYRSLSRGESPPAP